MSTNAKNSILLALFNKLDDHDRDIIIQLSESLVTKQKFATKNTSKKEREERNKKED